jgi:hypothetical protein
VSPARPGPSLDARDDKLRLHLAVLAAALPR